MCGAAPLITGWRKRQGKAAVSYTHLYNEHCFTGGGFIAPMALMAVPEEKNQEADPLHPGGDSPRHGTAGQRGNHRRGSAPARLFLSIWLFRDRSQPNMRIMVWFKICSAVCIGGYSCLL